MVNDQCPLRLFWYRLVVTDSYPQNQFHGTHDGPRLGTRIKKTISLPFSYLARWEKRVNERLAATLSEPYNRLGAAPVAPHEYREDASGAGSDGRLDAVGTDPGLTACVMFGASSPGISASRLMQHPGFASGR